MHVVYCVISFAFIVYVFLCVDVSVCLYVCREKGGGGGGGRVSYQCGLMTSVNCFLSVVDTFHSSNTAHDRYHYNHKIGK